MKFFKHIFLFFLLFASRVDAAVINFTGWEDGFLFSGNTALSTTIFHSGARGLHISATTTNTDFEQLLGLTTSGVYANFSKVSALTRFYFYYVTKPAANDEEMFVCQTGSNATTLAVRLNSSGNLAVYDSANALVATGATVLSASTWYRIDVDCEKGAAATYSLKINNVTELSGTANQTATNIGIINFGKRTNRNGQTVDFYYDDAYADDTSAPANGKSLVSIPAANGATFQWTAGTGPSDYTQVQDFNDGDTSYIKSSGAAAQLSLVSFQSTGTVGVAGTINAVRFIQIVREDISGTSANHLRVVSGGTTNTNVARNYTATYGFTFGVFGTDPNTSAAWASSALDSVQAGTLEDNAIAMRCTQISYQVDFVPADRAGSLAALGAGT